jgi:uncharacterized membrane protein
MSPSSPRSSRPELRTAGLIAAAALFVGSWALLSTDFYSAHKLIDTPVYDGYGQLMRVNEVPYRDFAVEYPPGALPVFVAPTFMGDYDLGFGWLMAALGLCCLALVALAGAPWWSVAFVAISPLLVGSLAYSRFDFWPAALLAAAIAALLADRHRLGWGLLAAAATAKLYPLLLLPLAVVWTLRRRGRRELAWAAGVGAAVAAVVVGPFLALAPGGLWDSFTGQLSRPLQIESLVSSFLTTFGSPVVESTHGSQNVAGHGTAAALSTVVGAAVLVALWVAFARGPADRERFVRYSAACVCTFIAFGKVLSPQYLIWLVPLVALLHGRRGIAALALLAAALLATQAWFPDHYWDYVNRFDRAWIVLVRNLLLVALVAVLSLPGRAPPRSA